MAALTGARSRAAAAGVLLLAGYCWFLLRHDTFCVGGADSSGYINTARRMVTGTLVARPRTLDRLGLSDAWAPIVTPLGYAVGPRAGTMTPFYPAGFPAHLALAGIAAGWERGPYFVSPLCAVGAVWLFFLFARELGLSRAWALCGAAVMGAWPIFLFQAIQPMSDAAATFWALACLLCALKARRGRGWATASGACFGIAVLVRPTDFLLALPLLFALPSTLSGWSLFAAGGAPLAVVQAAYNLHCYGSALRTGYHRGTLAGDLALRNVPTRFRHYASWIGKTLDPIVPLAWAAVVVDRRVGGRDRAMLLTWFGAFFLFYCFYQPYDSFTFLRYLLPALPALLAGALLSARDALAHLRRPKLAAALASVLLTVVLGTEVHFTRRLGVLSIADGESVYPRACAWAARRLPSRSVALAMQVSGSLEYYSDLSYARWDWMDPGRFALLRARLEPKGYRIFALLFPFEVDELARHAPGRWREIGRQDQVALFELEP